MSLIQRPKGRPTKIGQLEIQKELREYYERGVSASFTSSKTGINIKTVCDYFNKWTNEIKQIEEQDFLTRQKNERDRTLISLDYHIDELYKIFDDINDEITKNKKSGKGIPRYLFSIKLEIIKSISSLTEKKGSFSMQPIMDEFLEKKIEEIMKKHAQARKYN